MSEGKKVLERLLTKGGHFSDEDFSNISQYVADLEAERDRLKKLIAVLLKNEPDDFAGDAITVLDVWRAEAKQIIEDTQP